MTATTDHRAALRTVWAISLLTAFVVAVVSTSGAYLSNVMEEGWSEFYLSFFRWSFIYWGAWGVLAPFVYQWSTRNLIDARAWKPALLKLVAGAFFFTLLHVLIEATSMRIVPQYRHLHGGTYWGAVLAHGRQSAYANFATYTVIAGFCQGLGYYRRYKEEETNAALLQSTVARAELQMLRMQLQPHFLFNTLHSISTLMHRDVEAADRMLIGLSDLLRRVMETSRTQLVPLEYEVSFLKAYLDIEQVRFGDRLRIRYDIPDDTRLIEVPNLILQPLIENAIKHGFEQTGRPFSLLIQAERSGDRLRIRVEDDGVGLPHGFSETRFGIGLGLTRDRLRLLYEDRSRFTIEPISSGGTRAYVELPIDEDS